jgi:hypothetical protein
VANHSIGGYFSSIQTFVIIICARRQDQPRQRHHVECITEGRDGLAAEEEIKIAVSLFPMY